MTWKMQGPSFIQNHDERLLVLRDHDSSNPMPQPTYVGGKLHRSAEPVEMFYCQCNVQPLTGSDLMILPEGDRFDDQLWLWSNQVDKPLMTGDIVLRDGRIYQVQSCENWGSYSKSRLVFDDALADS